MMRRILIGLTLVGMVAIAPASQAKLACGPNTAFENDDVRVWFQGFKGHVKVFDKADEGNGNDGVYSFKTDAITEYDGETPVAAMNLERAFPQSTSECSVETETETDEDSGEETEVGKVITWVLSGDVRAVNGEGAGEGGIVGQALVTMKWHFNNEDNGTKFDLFVNDWPWQTEEAQEGENELAFAFDLTSSGGFEEAENGIGVQNNDGESAGHVSWDEEFEVKYEDESEQMGVVDSTSEVEENNASVELRFTGVDDEYVELIYDPWLGIGTYVIVGPIMIADSTINSLLDLGL